jgi:hypothetical protein
MERLVWRADRRKRTYRLSVARLFTARCCEKESGIQMSRFSGVTFALFFVCFLTPRRYDRRGHSKNKSLDHGARDYRYFPAPEWW